MLKEENYAKAYKEVFEILKYVNKEDLEKIGFTEPILKVIFDIYY